MTTIFKRVAPAFVWVLLVASKSQAAGPQTVLIVVHPKDSAAKNAAQQVSRGFREAVVRSGQKFQVAPQSGLYGDRDVDANLIQRDADALAAEGLLAYDNLEIDKAQKKFDQGLALFEQNLAEFDSIKPAARLALLAAGTSLVNNNERLGRTLIQRALLYDPNVQPDPRIYNSAMLAIFKDVRAKSSKGQKGSLEVSTNPAYSELYVDGAFVGMSPAKIDRLEAGPHFVRAVRDGFRPASDIIEIRPGSSQVATLNLIGMPQQMQVQNMFDKAVADLDRPISSSASALAAKGRATYVLVCSVSVSGDQVKLKASVFHADNRRLASGERSLSAASERYADEARGLWERLRDGIARAADAPAEPGVTSEEHLVRTTRTKPIVTGLLLGLGGAAMAAGGVFGILALLAQEPYRNLQQLSGEVAPAQADLQLKAVMADVLIFSGAAIATAGILCLILWDDRPSNKQSLGALPVRLDVSVSATGGFLGARGTF